MENIKPLTKDERRALKTLINVIEKFRSLDAKKNMPSQTILTLLYTRLLEDEQDFATVRDIGKKLDMSSAAASRNVYSLTEINRHYEEGKGLLHTHENPERRNEKIIRFTDKGEEFYKDVLNMVDAVI